MNKCPITYEPCGNDLYSLTGLKKFSPSLKALEEITYTAEDLRLEAMARATKLSIQGVQPKVSAVLNIQKNRFDLVDIGGKYIIKPQHHLFTQLPENEDVTMRMAKAAGIEVPLHALLWTKGGSLSYVIKRFDRIGRNEKILVEDFSQLAGMNRDTKYNYSMEKLVLIIDQYCTFPMLEKAKLFKIVLFNFLIGNVDMHLKNYSVITRNQKVELSPSYDLLNSTITLKGDIEEIALTLSAKKKKLTKSLLINYFGKERCGLTDKTVEGVINDLQEAYPKWISLLELCFLSTEMKEAYGELLEKRRKTLFAS